MSGLLTKGIGWLIAIVLVLGFISSGVPAHLAATLATGLANLVVPLQTVLVAVGVPAVLVGALVAISPKHRGLGVEIGIGGLVAVSMAVLAPVGVNWLHAQILAESPSLFSSSVPR